MIALPPRRLAAQPDVTQMLRGLLDKEVLLERAEPDPVDAYSAVYVNKHGQPVAAIVLDLGLAASFGAALALIPAAECHRWVEAGELIEDAHDCTYEVLNVLAAAFNQSDESRHVKLSEVLLAADDRSEVVRKGLAEPRHRSHYTVDVPGFPGGRMAVLAF